ncbi:MAG: hypothetical protein EOO46_22035 [Flavobacterium sp.]|nr:MAG: hypothetical protein EOO46_22035 [Flavobacterium sp.]
MKQLLCIITFVVFVSCVDKNEKITPISKISDGQISDSEIYEVINFMVDSLNSECPNKTKYLIESQTLEPRLLKRILDQVNELDSIFSKKDVDFIRKQAKSFFEFKLKQEFVKQKIVIPKDSLEVLITDKYNSQIYRDNLEKKYGTYRFIGIAMPLFSLDKSIVIVARDCDIGGGVDIYRKENGKWVLIRNLIAWIS